MQALLNSAELLADARSDLILWNGTAASWLGFERDTLLAETVRSATGIPATTALLAMNAELSRIGARRIALVTPYVATIEARIIANYRKARITVVSAVRADLIDNTAFADISPCAIAEMVRAAASCAAEAVVIMCTNLAGAPLATALAGELGLPVLDSVRVAIEHSLKLLREPA